MGDYVTYETCHQLAHALFAVPGVRTADDARAVMARFYGAAAPEPGAAACGNRFTLDGMIVAVAAGKAREADADAGSGSARDPGRE